MLRLHFAYMSPYQVLEYHMEFLETFGCIWSSKEVFKVIIGRAAHGSDQSGATPSSRSDLPIGATLPERQGGVARVFITRRRENESGATSRSDTARVPLNLKEVEPENLESTVVPDGFLCTLEWVEIKEVTIV
ncbi:hypothetical protein F2Q69_00021965 [Brassica cretica]|uniref:Uncharacterized protein n=1 Tax=Brassica cretica TaxID=69181 RepID=A0A8S9QND9_BRACR|nr:hypothetical protein F2Q69_00021965 [Brassica cretica]